MLRSVFALVLLGGPLTYVGVSTASAATGPIIASAGEGAGMPAPLKAAIDRTLSASSLEVVVNSGSSSGGSCSGSPQLTIYNAPDRYERESALPACRAKAKTDWFHDGPSIEIGNTDYQPGSRAGTFFEDSFALPKGLHVSPAELRESMLVPGLGQLTRSTRYEPTASGYRFTDDMDYSPVGRSRLSGSVAIAGGYLSSVSLLTQQSKSVLCGTVISPAESSSFGLRYSDLDAAPRVRAPAPRDVEHPQEASSSYGSFIYLSSGSSATACSGLQLRWSQGTVRARCWSSEHNPASGAPIDASRFSGRLCYRLGRAKLVVHRADVEPDFAVFERSGSSVPLEAVLDSGDSSDLRGIAARDPSGRLAVVMFGHILDKVQAAGIARSTGPITLPLGSPPAALTENVAASLGSNDV